MTSLSLFKPFSSNRDIFSNGRRTLWLQCQPSFRSPTATPQRPRGFQSQSRQLLPASEQCSEEIGAKRYTENIHIKNLRGRQHKDLRAPILHVGVPLLLFPGKDPHVENFEGGILTKRISGRFFKLSVFSALVCFFNQKRDQQVGVAVKVPKDILDQNGLNCGHIDLSMPNWTEMAELGPSWHDKVRFGPFRLTNCIGASPEQGKPKQEAHSCQAVARKGPAPPVLREQACMAQIFAVVS